MVKIRDAYRAYIVQLLAAAGVADAEAKGAAVFNLETKIAKAQAEAELARKIDELGIHLVVLARYMQILSDDLCRRLSGRSLFWGWRRRPARSASKAARPS